MIPAATRSHAAPPWDALAITLALALATSSAPASASAAERFAFEAAGMGTKFRIVLFADDAAAARASADAAFALAAEFNAKFSDYDAGSELMRLVAAREAAVSEELFRVLELAQELAQQTRGAFDVTNGAHSRNWRRAAITGELPDADAIARAKQASGWRKLELDPAERRVRLGADGMFLDLGGIAKGFTADAMLALLRERGHPRASVAAGGDVALGDPPPGRSGWEVGLASTPGAPRQSLTLARCGVSTSGDAEQAIEIGGKRYSHIVDPATGLGVVGRPAVSVVAESAALSDAWATALSVLGREEGEQLARAAGLRAIWHHQR